MDCKYMTNVMFKRWPCLVQADFEGIRMSNTFLHKLETR